MQVLEQVIETRCVRHAKREDWVVIKLQKLAGWPDRLFLGPDGRHFFVEFKRENRMARKLQEYIHETLKCLGHKVYLVDNFEDFKCIFSRESAN